MPGRRRGSHRPGVCRRKRIENIKGGALRGTRGLLPLRALMGCSTKVDAAVGCPHSAKLPVARKLREGPQAEIAPSRARPPEPAEVLGGREAQHLKAQFIRQCCSQVVRGAGACRHNERAAPL